MKPTRAPEMRSSTPSSIPSPALRMGHTATFLPEMRGIGATSSGVSTSTSSVGKSFVASYVSRYVTSSTSLRKCTVGVSLSRRYESLCWTSGCRTSVTVIGRSRSVRRVPAEARVERPPVAQPESAVTQLLDARCLVQRVHDDRADLAEVVHVEAAHRRGGCAEPDAGGDHRRALVERHGVPVCGQPAGF